MKDVEAFVATCGLEDKLALLQKASLLLRPDVDEQYIPGITREESRALDRESTHRWRQPRTLYVTILACSFGAIEQGWAQTGMNGANLYIPQAFGIDSESTRDTVILGLINSGLFLSQALCGSTISDPVNNRFGRRGAIFFGSALCLTGNLGSAISWSWPILVFFRLILGAGLGLNASTVSVYAAESAPAYIRGGLAVSWQMFTAFGIFLGFLANVAFYDMGPDVIWRFQLAAPLVPAVPLLLMIYLCPESPAWQIKRLRFDLALSSLIRLRSTDLQAARELYSAYLSQQKNSKQSGSTQEPYLQKLTSLFTIPRNRHALLGSYTVMLSQQLCGINIISFYSSTIFSTSGSSELTALWASVIFGLVNFLGAFPAVWTMDTFGRRRLLLWTLPPMAFVMALAGMAFRFPEGTLQFVLLAGLIYLFCALYSPGMGPVPCAYSAEIYPLPVREVGMSFAVATASMWATVLSLTFPTLLERLGQQGTFELYAALNLLAWALCWCLVRETKGVKLEDMDAIFESSPRSFVKARWVEGAGGCWRRRRVGKGWREVGQDDEDEE